MTEGRYFTNKDFFQRYSHIESILIKDSKFKNVLKYSIVIPTYGRADLLSDAINSCLRQTYKGDFKILIVDNDPMRGNETEKLIFEINDDRIAYYKNTENIGCLGNFNRCIELSDSEYVIMLHTDDLLDSVYLDTVIPLVDQNPEVDMLIPGKRIIRNGIMSRQKGLGFLSRNLALNNRAVRLNERDFCHYNTTGGPLGILMKRELCLEIGGFNEDIFPMSDYAFWVRMARKYRVFYLPKELGTYRFFNNISSEEGMQQNYIISEYHLINALIKGKKYQGIMSGYLYEYVNYRVNVSGLDRDEVFSSATGQKYRLNPVNKLKFAYTVIRFSLSYIMRATGSKIRV